ncbi:MAG: energy transducer TonB [Fibrobacterota bacterium]
MNIIAHLLMYALKGVLVLAINVMLFLVIPATHNLFGMFEEEKEEVVQQKRVVAELVKPKPKPKEQKQPQRIRSVSNASSQPMQSRMKFDLKPDLSVQGSAGGVGIESQELQAEVFEEGEVDQNVVPITTSQPAYPSRARDLAIEGTVTITFVVNEDGRVSTIEKIDAPHQSFVSETRKSVSQWRFKPAQNKGVPVKQRVRISIDFSLDQ